MAEATADKLLKQSNEDLNNDLKTMGNRSYLLLSLLFFFGMLALSIWGIIPQFNTLTTQRAQIQTDKVKVTELQEKLTQIKEITNNQHYLEQADNLDQILYTNNPFMEVLYSLTKVSEDNDIIFNRFEYSPGLIATPSAQFSTSANSASARNLSSKQNQGFTIYIETSGNYLDVVNFLDQLENTAPLMSVSYAEINNSLLGYVTAKIEILANYYKPNVVAQLDDPLPTISGPQETLLNQLSQYQIPNSQSSGQQNSANLVSGNNNLFQNAIQTYQDQTGDEESLTDSIEANNQANAGNTESAATGPLNTEAVN